MIIYNIYNIYIIYIYIYLYIYLYIFIYYSIVSLSNDPVFDQAPRKEPARSPRGARKDPAGSNAFKLIEKQSRPLKTMGKLKS